MTGDKRYSYKLPLGNSIFGGLAALAAGLFMMQMGLTNDRGLVLNGIIHFDTGGATLFYLAIGLISLVGAVLLGLGAYKSVTAPGEVLIGNRTITLPKSRFFPGAETIPFDSISKADRSQYGKQEWLTLHHRTGKISLYGNMFENSAVFDEVCQLIAVRTMTAHDPVKGGDFQRAPRRSGGFGRSV